MHPFCCFRQADFKLKNDAVGTISVLHLVDVTTCQFDNFWFWFNSENLHGKDVSVVAQHAMAQGADTARTA
ncbi:hypothetical protein D9M69_691740 [compost metagenome]